MSNALLFSLVALVLLALLAQGQDEHPMVRFKRTKESLTPAQAKIDSTFWPDLGLDVDALTFKAHQRRRSGAGEDVVEVEIHANITSGLLRLLDLHGQVTFFSAQFHSITAELPASILETVASQEEVWRISPLEPFATWGLSTSEGVTSHRLDQVRQKTSTFRGRGIKVGVISDSADHLAQVQASGDLPAVTILPNRAGSGTGEGTAMLEIVHDMAPEAQLYFSTGGTSQAAFATNILALADAGCKVIVDDIIFFGEPVYEDGPISDAVNQVTARGVAYFSSAGNIGNLVYNTGKVWEGNYQPVPIPASLSGMAGTHMDVHSFASGQPYARVMGTAFTVTLHWVDRFNSPSSDYDVVITNAAGTVLKFSAEGGKAYEYISFQGPAYAEYRVYVLRYSGSARLISLRVYGKLTMSPATKGNIFGHTAAEGAFSIAATPKFSYGNFYDRMAAGQALRLESFCSQGPRRIFYSNGQEITPGVYTSAGGRVRNKPDFTAADGGATSTPGFANFYGTSAAAPHAAGLAAAYLSWKPTTTPAQLRNAFMAASLDVLSPGWDDVSGHGVVDAMLLFSPDTGSSTPTTAPTSPPTSAPTSLPLFCPAQSYANANWPATVATMTTTGTCVAGYSGSPRRTCQLNGSWGSITGACTQVKCPAQSYANANWPITIASATATGTCAAGYSGSPRRVCQSNGAWGSITGACTQIKCPAQSYVNANWPVTVASATATGTCVAGYSGSPRRTCQSNGSWGSITGACTQIKCPAQSYVNANWPVTIASATATGTCVAGYSGSPRRVCQSNGAWGSITGACTQIKCPAQSYVNAKWPITIASATATGTCIAGYTGSPRRVCQSNGYWGSITGACTQIKCPAQSYANANWPITIASATATGTCAAGYTGSPRRVCQSNGSWGSITGACTKV